LFIVSLHDSLYFLSAHLIWTLFWFIYTLNELLFPLFIETLSRFFGLQRYVAFFSLSKCFVIIFILFYFFFINAFISSILQDDIFLIKMHLNIMLTIIYRYKDVEIKRV